MSQIHATWLLNEIDSKAWSVPKTFLSPSLVQCIALEDELIGSRSAENQVKMISHKRDGCEGQAKDSLADELVPFIVDSRFRRRSEPQAANKFQILASLNVVQLKNRHGLPEIWSCSPMFTY